MRKRRLDLRLLQREVAALLGVSKSTLEGWERNRHPPTLKHIPAVVEFLGHIPFPEPVTLAERLRLYRKLNGISGRELAHRLSVDESTLRRWEAEVGMPGKRFQARLSALLSFGPSAKRGS